MEPCESALGWLKENAADVCTSHIVTGWELDGPRYGTAEAAEGEWVTVPDNIEATGIFQKKLPGQQGDEKVLVSTDSPSHHLFLSSGLQETSSLCPASQKAAVSGMKLRLQDAHAYAAQEGIFQGGTRWVLAWSGLTDYKNSRLATVAIWATALGAVTR